MVIRDISVLKILDQFPFYDGNKQYQIYLIINCIFYKTWGVTIDFFGDLYSKLITTTKRRLGGKLLLEVIV